MQKNLIDLNKYLGWSDPQPPAALTKLKLVDKQIILLALEGFSPREIVEQLSTSSHRVRRVLQSKLADQIFEDFLSFKDREFQSLYQLSISAVRDALRSDDIEVRLKAADKFFKAHNKYDRSSGSAGATAEDVIRRIMEVKITEEIPAKSAESQILSAPRAKQNVLSVQDNDSLSNDSPSEVLSVQDTKTIVADFDRDSLSVQNLDTKEGKNEEQKKEDD